MRLDGAHLGNEKSNYQSGDDDEGDPERHLPSWSDFPFALRLRAQKPSVTGSVGAKFHGELRFHFFRGSECAHQEDNPLTAVRQDPSPASLKYGGSADSPFIER